MPERRGTTLALAAGIAAATVGVQASSAGAAPAPRAAASGYVKDRSCAICHSELYQSYQEVGMARSFFRPSRDKIIEDFGAGNHYFHEPSGRHYEMRHDDGRFVFRRYQLDDDGEPINVFEQEIDWVLGSGNHSRTYLFATAAGELYELPLAWYTQTSSWGMAPGFDSPDHYGLTRRVRRECMFCHDAYPEVPAGSDEHFAPHTFPPDLPEGTGCQRCHGPGAAHVRAATEELENKAWVRASIVNPGRLPPRLRDDVCDQCHLQPTVALAGVRRFDRADYSFRPGQSLDDYMVQMEVEVAGEERADRFEINHHPYRLRQSRCYEQSGRELSCLTCHDPHRKVKEEERAAHYRAACLGCHEVDACKLEPMTAGAAASGVDPQDCVACHMPKRRPSDVVRVVMTDHFIRRRPGGPELLAPREESEPVLVDLELLHPDRAPDGDLGEIYRAVAVLRAGGNVDAVDHLGNVLARASPPDVEPYLDLARGQMQQRRFAAAQQALLAVLRRQGGNSRALEWLAISRQHLGRTEEAAELLRGVTRANPDRAEAWFNLGVILAGAGEPEEAVASLKRAVEKRHVMAPAWFYLGLAYAELGRLDDAVAALRRSLQIDPLLGRAYLALGEVLTKQGERREALRYWRHGVRYARRPDVVEALKRRLGEAVAPETP